MGSSERGYSGLMGRGSSRRDEVDVYFPFGRMGLWGGDGGPAA